MHGVVAAAALERVLKEGSEKEIKEHLQAIKKGSVRHLRLDLTRSTAIAVRKVDKEAALRGVLDALKPDDGASTCEVLSICTRLGSLPKSMNRLTTVVELSLEHCTGLKGINLHGMNALRKLQLAGCSSLLKLSDLPTSLEELDFEGCGKLRELPSNLDKLKSLERLNANGCRSLTSVPSISMSLNDLDLGRCSCLQRIPTISSLGALTALNLEGCKGLQELPGHFCQLSKLKKLNLCNCINLKTLPDMSSILDTGLSLMPGLTEVDTGLSSNKDGFVYVHGCCAQLVRSWQGCGFAPGCNNGRGRGYGVYSNIMLWVKPIRCDSCPICDGRWRASMAAWEATERGSDGLEDMEVELNPIDPSGSREESIYSIISTKESLPSVANAQELRPAFTADELILPEQQDGAAAEHGAEAEHISTPLELHLLQRSMGLSTSTYPYHPQLERLSPPASPSPSPPISRRPKVGSVAGGIIQAPEISSEETDDDWFGSQHQTTQL